MSKIAVLAKLKSVDGQRSALVDALQTALQTAAGEAGTMYYLLHEDPSEENTLWFYELYADQAALDAHRTSDAFKALGAAIRDLVDGRPELTMLTPIGGKGF
jgi:quinol monooxygenase YgiN